MTSPLTITPEQAVRTILERRKMRRNLSPFVRKVFETINPGIAFKHNWHIDCMCEHLEAVFYGELRRLIINVHPRSFKSGLASVAFPAWVLGKDPTARFLCASYGDKLATELSVNTRLVLEHPWYMRTFEETRIAPGENEKTQFKTTRRGHRIATSVGGSATGKGGNFLVVDDPIKVDESTSVVKRQAANTWFDQEFTQRVDDPMTGAIVIVMQRTHQNDLTGHCQKKDGGWTVLKLPTEAPKRTVIEFRNFRKVREAGELLHPERVGPKEVAQARADLGEAGYEAQHGQNPAPPGGGVFKRTYWKRHRVIAGNRVLRVHSWDTGYKKETDRKLGKRSYSCCTCWIATEDAYYLADAWRDHVEYHELKQKFTDLYNRDLPDWVIVEDKASGISLIQEMRRDTNIPIFSYNPGDKDKYSRAAANQPLIESGLVSIPESAPWVDEFIEEHAHVTELAMPEYTEYVDTTSQALKFLKERVPTLITLGGSEEPDGEESLAAIHEGGLV